MKPSDLRFQTPPVPWSARDWDWFAVAWLERRRALRYGVGIGLSLGVVLTELIRLGLRR